MSSVVETSQCGFLHSLRSVEMTEDVNRSTEMTVSVNMYVITKIYQRFSCPVSYVQFKMVANILKNYHLMYPGDRDNFEIFKFIWSVGEICISLPEMTYNMNLHKCPDMEEFKAILKKHSLKATPQRLAVHEAMTELGHASADMVTELIKEKGTAKVTLASVYNILTQMAMLKVYSYRLSANNKMYFDVNTFKHMHLYDQENHTFRDVIDDELIELIEAHLGRKRIKGYRIEDIDIQLVGRPTRKKYLV